MFKKILVVSAFLLALVMPVSIIGASGANAPGVYQVSAKAKIGVHPRTDGGWEKIDVNEYDVAVVWVTNNPESYYILDARADLCFFVVATTNGISTTRIPCKPFLNKIEALEDKFDNCK
jgi:hypothetical protein